MSHGGLGGGLPGVAAQKQALNAMVFYLKRVRGLEQVDLRNFQKERDSQRLPVVLSRAEMLRLLDAADEEGRRGGLAEAYALMLQELLGHQSVQTTMIYTHVLNDPYRKIGSPLDEL